MIDSRDIALLHPTLQRAARELIARMKSIGYNVLVTSTYRDFAAQNKLYAQGRTAPGKIVTNAKAGQSMHNYRLAFDICKNVVGQEYSDANFFKNAGKIGQEMGLTWGGSWIGFTDTPHFEFTNRLTLGQLQSGMTVPANTIMKWEKVPPKEEDEMVEKTNLMINGNIYVVDRILKDGTNFIKLRDLEKGGAIIEYDAEKKLPKIDF